MSVLFNVWGDKFQQSFKNFSSSSIDCYGIPFFEDLTISQFKIFFIFIIFNHSFSTTYTGSSHTSGNNGSMRGHTSSSSQNTLSNVHTFDIFRASFKSNKNYFFTAFKSFFSIFGSEYNESCSCSRGSIQTFT